jgi:ferrous iron transport protein A
MPELIQPLTSVTVGSTATVAEIKVPPQNRPRLMEMGLLVGTPVELVRFAPLGDPVEIKVRGYNLTLRKHEAEQILVRSEAPETRGQAVRGPESSGTSSLRP